MPTGLLAFLIFGVLVGINGTLVGAGRGFIIVPVLLLAYHASPQQASDTSLAIVFFNALSGSLAYVRQGKVDYRTDWRFALAAVPGALFGVLLLVIAAFLLLRSDVIRAIPHRFGAGGLPPATSTAP